MASSQAHFQICRCRDHDRSCRGRRTVGWHRSSAFDGFEPRVRSLLAEFPPMPASVIAERLGWEGSASWFRK